MVTAYLLLTLLLSALAPNASLAEATGSRLRGAAVVEIPASQHRQLSWGGGFDFSNLLFHLGVCPEHSCEDCAREHGPPHPPLPHCGCPNCDLPHAHHLPQCACVNGAGGGSGGGGHGFSGNGYGYNSNGDGVSGSSEGADESSANDGGENGLNDGQTATRKFSMVVYVAGAAACAAMLAAVAMRKRETEARAIDLEGDDFAHDVASSSSEPLSAKMGAVLASMGLGIPSIIVTMDGDDVDEAAAYEAAPEEGIEVPIDGATI